MQQNDVKSFVEKPKGDKALINGGFVLSPKVIDLIDNDNTSWEGEPLRKLAEMNELAALSTMASAAYGHASREKYVDRVVGL